MKDSLKNLFFGFIILSPICLSAGHFEIELEPLAYALGGASEHGTLKRLYITPWMSDSYIFNNSEMELAGKNTISILLKFFQRFI